MTEHIDQMVNAVEGDGPSADFVASLRNEVLSEAAGRSNGFATPHDDEPTTERVTSEDEHHRRRPPSPPTKRNWPIMLIGTAAATALVVALVFQGRDGSQVVTTDRPDVTHPAIRSILADPIATSNDPEAPGSSAPEPSGDAAGETVRFEPAAEVVDRDPAFIEAGTHRIDTLGTAFTFELEDAMFVEPNSGGAAALSDPTASGQPGDRTIHLMRMSALSDPDQPTTPFDDFSSGWPADDADGWLDRLPAGIVLSDREATTLGGLPATLVELRLDDVACGPDPNACINFATNNLVSTTSLRAKASFRVWFVDQGAEDPLAVVIGIRNESDSDWFEVADAVLDSLAFGDVQPNPVTAVTPGRSELPFLGGISMEFTADATSVETRHHGVIALLGDDGQVELLTNPRAADGEPLTTTDALVAELEPQVASLSELDSVLVDGLPARVFDIEGANLSRSTLSRALDDQRGWFAPSVGRIWLIEHPERGLLMATAEYGGTTGPEFDAVVARADRLVASIEFVEPS